MFLDLCNNFITDSKKLCQHHHNMLSPCPGLISLFGNVSSPILNVMSHYSNTMPHNTSVMQQHITVMSTVTMFL